MLLSSATLLKSPPMTVRRLLAVLGLTVALGAGLIVPASVPTAEAAPGVAWGAIAWQYSGRSGGAYGFRTQQGAIREAKRRCGADCGYFAFANTCGAIAYRFTYARNYVGTARGYPTHAAAERAARRQLPGGIASRRPNSVCSFPR